MGCSSMLKTGGAGVLGALRPWPAGMAEPGERRIVDDAEIK